MTLTRLRLIVVLSGSVTACSGSAPIIAPTPTSIQRPTPPPTSPNSNLWRVTIQTTAVTGPSFCIVTPSVGSTFQGDYMVALSEDTVSFVPPDPIDWDTFMARLTGSRFTATNPPIESGRGMCTHYLQASDLAGSFSPDTNSFTAIENWYFTLDSGEVKRVTFSWSGTRQ